MTGFYSLHNHSQYSNIRMLDCIIKPKDLVQKAIDLGYKGIALTDHESLSGSIDMLKIRDSIKETNPDFKIIFGNEIYLIEECMIKNTPKYYHFILLAKDEIGWKQLQTLSDRAWDRSYVEKGLRRTPTTYKDLEEIVKPNPGHVFASTACLGGYLPNCILDHEVDKANRFVQWCIKVFGADNIALEIQPSDSEEQTTVNRVLVNFANHYNLPYIVTTDSHYLEKDDFNIHSAFLNSKQSSDRETEKFYRFTYMMNEEEIRSLLKLSKLTDQEIDIAFSNTCKIANQIVDFDFRHDTNIPCPNLPQFKLEHILKPWYEQYECIKYYAYSKYDQDQYLLYLIEQGIKSKGISIDTVKAERINTELDVLRYITDANNQPVSGYLNLVKTIEDIIWEISFIGVSRGSAMSFYINYLIGIVQANPLDYDIAYWRFLNKARSGAGNWPDVDIDIAPSKTEDVINLLKQRFGEKNVINCATFKTESLKSAILTAMRGLGYNNDDAQAIASLVPAHRGKIYSLQDCLEGNEEMGFEPVPGFQDKLNQYPKLLDTIRKIEGLSTNASIHASAVYITKEGYDNYVSCMRAPNGTKITSLNMHDSDDCGMLKFDLLRTDAEEKLMQCMSLLLEHNEIQWQGSLRSTYDKYLHPDHLIYNNSKMWADAASGKIANLFQFETQVGAVCIAKTRPENIKQMGAANAVMRLQAEGGKESPIDRYVRFRNDNDLWYLEMAEAGLNGEEVKILEKYLKHKFGCAVEQEDVMQLLMDPQVANFTLKEADHARKIIAKKKLAEITQLKDDFYNAGVARKEFSDYVWTNCIEPQLGYSFSVPHDIGYSLIALQEMNCASNFNSLYWQCACLNVNSGNSNTDAIDEENDEDDKLIEEEENNAEEAEKGAKTKRVAPNYGKIAKAISDAQLSGVKIDLPDINEAEDRFIPDIQRNSILYSLQAVNTISFDLLDRIIQNRPYTGVLDFYNKVQPTQSQMIGIIKAGCFDNLCSMDRKLIMEKFLYYLANQQYPKKEKMTAVQLKKALDMGLNLDKYSDGIRMYKFKKYLDSTPIDTSSKTRRYILKEEVALKFFNAKIKSKLDMNNFEYGYLPNNSVFIKCAAFDKLYQQELSELMIYLNSDEGRTEFMNFEQKIFINELKEKYCQGNLSTWEMETMCFYHGSHELKGMNEMIYNTKDFNQLPENPVAKVIMDKDGNEKNIYNSCTLAGTVTNSDNNKHIVSILTLHGIVNIKLYTTFYTQYNQKISTIDNKTKKKTTIEDSWFTRGNKILVHGYRRENMFIAKPDYSQGGMRCVGLIENILPDGTISVRYKRNKK